MPFLITLMGKMGDIIYQLAAVRRLSLDRNDMASIHLFQDDFLSLTAAEIAFLSPYLSTLDYVADVSQGTGETSIMDWFSDRDHQKNLVLGLFEYLGLNPERAKEAWLPVTCEVDRSLVLVNRSARHHGLHMDWKGILSNYPHARFVGLTDEHQAFCALVEMELTHLVTADFISLANTIASCRRFLGNQSMPLALAHGMRKQVVVETDVATPNCIFLRGDA
jgi:hypothetical protein